MNTDQLKKGKDLTEAIERLTKQKGIWENAQKFYAINLLTTFNSSSNYGADTNTDHVNFELMKTLTLDTINKKLEEVQKEFDAL